MTTIHSDKKTFQQAFCVAAIALAGCASSGTEPHAMTAGQHQAAAQAEDQSAAQHQAKYDPSQTKAAGSDPEVEYTGACVDTGNWNCSVRWTSENATEQHLKSAQTHRQLAEKHRAASQALRDAEHRFCSGISAADRDLSPFFHREDVVAAQGLKKSEDLYGQHDGDNIVQIQQIEREVFGPGGLRGARVTFRAVPGMTGEWLQRVVDCHLAQNAVIGSDPTMSFCPLAVAHATASVTSTGNGFAIDITSDDANSVQEIIKRAWKLGPSGPNAMQ